MKILRLLTIAIMLSSGCLWADDGIDDPDFDFLPQDEPSMFGSALEYAWFKINRSIDRATHPSSYDAAKRLLYNRVGDQTTLYCGCTTRLKERDFLAESCGYIPRNDNKRAHRTEAEHVLPASLIAAFDPKSSCWEKNPLCGKERKCCLANDPKFKKAHNDLVNLIPAIGELNADRLNYLHEQVDGELRRYGNCDFEVKLKKPKVAEPRPEIRGDIARIYFYMAETYKLVLPDKLVSHLKGWDEADPVSEEERQRNSTIQFIQGSANPSIQ